MFVVDETAPEAAYTACAGKGLGIIDKAEDVEADLDGETAEKVNLEPWRELSREVSKLAQVEKVDEASQEAETSLVGQLRPCEGDFFEQLARVIRIHDGLVGSWMTKSGR